MQKGAEQHLGLVSQRLREWQVLAALVLLESVYVWNPSTVTASNTLPNATAAFHLCSL